MIQPGPATIEPNTQPGGLVFHFYRIPDQALLHVSKVGLDTAEAMAAVDREVVAQRAAAHDICIVIYDGDTGERMLPPGYAPGDRLT